MADIYLLIEGKQEGPYTEEQVRQSLAEGLIPLDLPAWHEGLPDWISITTLLPQNDVNPPPISSAGTLDTNCIKNRTIAVIIDSFLFGLIALPLFLMLELIWSGIGDPIALTCSVLAVTPVVAFILSSDIQATLGMALCGIALGDKKGGGVTLQKALLRHLASFLSCFFFLGFFLCTRNPQRQTLHDLICGTVVFRKVFKAKEKLYQSLLMLAFFVASVGSAAVILFVVKPTSLANVAVSLGSLKTTEPTGGDASSTEADVPQDSAGHVTGLYCFKIIHIVSPGRAIVYRSTNPVLYMAMHDSDGTVSSEDKEYVLIGVPQNLVDDDVWSGYCFNGGIWTYDSQTLRSYVVSTHQK